MDIAPTKLHLPLTLCSDIARRHCQKFLFLRPKKYSLRAKKTTVGATPIVAPDGCPSLEQNILNCAWQAQDLDPSEFSCL